MANDPSFPIGVVTAVYNRATTIQATIDSVQSQSLSGFEYTVVDGLSSDGTDDVVCQNRDLITHSIRERDNGIYDALNKGLAASKADVIGFLHADDMFASNRVLELVNSRMDIGDCDAVYGDLVYVRDNDPSRVVRYWKAGEYSVERFRLGWMPPHPTVYMRREVYDSFGGYRTDLGSAADYECMVRLMVLHGIRVAYIPHVLVKMRVGGASNASFRNRLAANRADRRAWELNGLRPPFALRFTKPLRKLGQFISFNDFAAVRALSTRGS